MRTRRAIGVFGVIPHGRKGSWGLWSCTAAGGLAAAGCLGGLVSEANAQSMTVQAQATLTNPSPGTHELDMEIPQFDPGTGTLSAVRFEYTITHTWTSTYHGNTTPCDGKIFGSVEAFTTWTSDIDANPFGNPASPYIYKFLEPNEGGGSYNDQESSSKGPEEWRSDPALLNSLTGTSTANINGSLDYTLQLDGCFPLQGFDDYICDPTLFTAFQLTQYTISVQVTYYYGSVGACCRAFGGFCSVVPESECVDADFPGVYLGDGTTCQPYPCASVNGACCDESGFCSISTFDGCFGTYAGDGTTCETVECEAAMVACCRGSDGACVIVPADQCDRRNGDQQIFGGSCPPNNLCVGSCCGEDGSCTPSLPNECSGQWSFPFFGEPCADPCFVFPPQPGACSNGTECFIALEENCCAPYTFYGEATTCEDLACPADFNGVNGVTVQDIFDFLTAWLAGNSSADFNSVNGVTVQDIFDFLTAWLAGC